MDKVLVTVTSQRMLTLKFDDDDNDEEENPQRQSCAAPAVCRGECPDLRPTKRHSTLDRGWKKSDGINVERWDDVTPSPAETPTHPFLPRSLASSPERFESLAGFLF